jgi:hypothetical protein
MPDTQHPPQATIPDDLVPNRTGYRNEQLAIRTLAEVIGTIILHAPIFDNADVHLACTKAINDVFALTEPD